MDKLTSSLLETYEKTVLKIFEFADKYKSDCNFLAYENLEDIFDFIKNLEYKQDPKGIEFLSRPKFSIFRTDLPRDCDDKTLIAACVFELKDIPYRIVISGKTKKPHHVYPEIFINNGWIPFDATYKRGLLGKRLYKEIFRKVYEKIID